MLASSSTPSNWPVVKGSFQVVDPAAPVAVCVLTSEELISPAGKVAGVAICGSVQTANSGIEAIVLNTISNPNLRFLVLCGKDSKLFRQGQSLVALHANGIDSERMIIGAEGHEPQLSAISPEAIRRFQEQISLVDLRGVEDLEAIGTAVEQALTADPGPLESGFLTPTSAAIERIKPGGSRAPLAYDAKGYFVITVEPDQGEIHIVHFGPDRLPAHEMRGRTAEPMLLGLLRERLVSQLSHAGYLGAELAKAETALRLGRPYVQDRALARPRPH